jgi:hypothetical protein
MRPAPAVASALRLQGAHVAGAQGLGEPVVDAAASGVERRVRRVDREPGARGLEDDPLAWRPVSHRRQRIEDRRVIGDDEVRGSCDRFRQHRLGEIDREHRARNGVVVGAQQQADPVPVGRVGERRDLLERARDVGYFHDGVARQ